MNIKQFFSATLIMSTIIFFGCGNTNSKQEKNATEYSKDDGHEHKEGDGHDHKEGDGHEHKEGDHPHDDTIKHEHGG